MIAHSEFDRNVLRQKKVSRTISSQVRKSGKNVELACRQEFYSEQISLGHYGHGSSGQCIKCVF